MRYSKSTGGFYDPAIHTPAQIPADAVDVGEVEYERLLAGQSAGQRIVGDAAGKPMLVVPTPTPDEALAGLRRARDAALRESDADVLRRLERGEPVPADLLAYRQALRDAPATGVMPGRRPRP